MFCSVKSKLQMEVVRRWATLSCIIYNHILHSKKHISQGRDPSQTACVQGKNAGLIRTNKSIPVSYLSLFASAFIYSCSTR